MFWDVTTQVVAVTNMVYNFPIVPLVYNVTGCSGPNQDADVSELVQAVNCPTIGGPIIVLTGLNFVNDLYQLKVVIGGSSDLTLDGSRLTVSADAKTLKFALPPGSGTALSIQVPYLLLLFACFPEVSVVHPDCWTV